MREASEGGQPLSHLRLGSSSGRSIGSVAKIPGMRDPRCGPGLYFVGLGEPTASPRRPQRRRRCRRRTTRERLPVSAIGRLKCEGHPGHCHLKAAPAMPPASSSPRPATTPACFYGGSQNSCVPSSGPSPKLSRLQRSPKSSVVRVLHGRLNCVAIMSRIIARESSKSFWRTFHHVRVMCRTLQAQVA